MSLNFLDKFDYLWVGFSGGLDSTVLLHKLSQSTLAKKLGAVHINHNLSPHAIEWQTHCRLVCANLAIPLIEHSVSLPQTNIEGNARSARYACFQTLIKPNTAIVLAHHHGDQAETVLLQLSRGTGLQGLAAMAAITPFGAGAIVRPLLDYSKQSLEDYADKHQLVWINDESNTDTYFSRNFVRHAIIPQLKTRWSSIENNLVQTAKHCRESLELLDALARIDCPHLQSATDVLPIKDILPLGSTRIKNILRIWLKNLRVTIRDTAMWQRILSDIIANDHASIEISSQLMLHRFNDHLYARPKKPKTAPISYPWNNFPEPLIVSSQTLCVSETLQGLSVPPNSRIEIRFRQGGERFYWHKQHKTLKKLFQEWQIPAWQRDEIPLVYINDELAAVIGYAISDHFFVGK